MQNFLPESYSAIKQLSESNFGMIITNFGEEKISIGPTYFDNTIRVNRNYFKFLETQTKSPYMVLNFVLAHELAHHVERLHFLKIDSKKTTAGYTFLNLKDPTEKEVFSHSHIDCLALSLMKNASMKFDIDVITDALITIRDECVEYRGKEFCEAAHAIRLAHVESWFKSLRPSDSLLNLEDISLIQSSLAESFSGDMRMLNFKGFQISIDDESPDYVGGVKIVESKITVGVGRNALSKYTLATFRFMVCHELGHYLGGAPFKMGAQYINSKISTEGQSDYWAASACLPKLSDDPIDDAEKFFIWLRDALLPLPLESEFYSIPQKGVIDTRFYDSEYMSFQCRLNTIEAGVAKRPRPSCWFK